MCIRFLYVRCSTKIRMLPFNTRWPPCFTISYLDGAHLQLYFAFGTTGIPLSGGDRPAGLSKKVTCMIYWHHKITPYHGRYREQVEVSKKQTGSTYRLAIIVR